MQRKSNDSLENVSVHKRIVFISEHCIDNWKSYLVLQKSYLSYLEKLSWLF